MKIAEIISAYCAHHSCDQCELLTFCHLGQSVGLDCPTSVPATWNKKVCDKINKSFEGYEVYNE